MAKRLSEKQKKTIVKFFLQGRAVDNLAEEFDCSKTTIIRNLKRSIGDDKYKELSDQSKTTDQSINSQEEKDAFERDNFSEKEISNEFAEDNLLKEDFSPITPFTEITPLNFEIEDSLQKDLSSVSINEVNLPKIVYMIVDKEIELDVKYLKEYPDWQFLAKNELNRKTIAIY